MKRGMIHFELTGDKETKRMFRELPDKMRKKVASNAVRASAYRMRKPVAQATPQNTGRLKGLIIGAPVRSAGTRKDFVRVGWLLPTREKLGLPAKGGYYPTALEYGYPIYNPKLKAFTGKRAAPIRYIRGTADRETAKEWKLIAQDIAKITHEARKLGAAPRFSRKGL